MNFDSNSNNAKMANDIKMRLMSSFFPLSKHFKKKIEVK